MYHNANNGVAFLTGWVITTVKVFFILYNLIPFVDFATKLIGAMVWGGAGGMGAILAKDAYLGIKKYIRKRQIKKSILKSKTK